MWQGFDPEITRDLMAVKAQVSRRYQRPTREWPLIFVGEHDALLVVREWPERRDHRVLDLRDSPDHRRERDVAPPTVSKTTWSYRQSFSKKPFAQSAALSRPARIAISAIVRCPSIASNIRFSGAVMVRIRSRCW